MDDTTGNDLGNSFTTSGTNAIGDASNNTTEFRVVFEFDISSFRSDINSAGTVALEFDVVTPLTSTDFDVELIALSGAAEDGVALASDFQATGSSVSTFNTSTITAGTVSIDVTSFAKADAADLGSDFSSFRLQGIGLSNGNGVTDLVRLDGFTANLVTTTIPEPSTYALSIAALAGVVAMIRRRSR